MTDTTNETRVGLGLLGSPDVPQMVELAVRAERNGFESVWVAETRLTRDGIAPCAAIATRTSRMKVATGIVNVYTRGPVLTAVSFLSLDELAGGRVIMGLGTGSPLVLKPQGVDFHRPVTRLRETIDVVQALLRGEQVTYSGQTIRVDGAKLEAAPPRPHIPLYLGVTGPRALELCGEKADGAMLNAFLPPAYVARARERIAAGARRAGRDPGGIDVGGAVVVSIDEDSRRAKDQARPFVAMYLSLFPNIAQETGLDEARVGEVRSAFETGGAEAGAALIGDDVVDSLTASGTVGEGRAAIARYRAAGLALPILFPLEASLSRAVDALGP